MLLYHISHVYLGKRVTLVPRIPESAPDSESPIDRICVAPTVAQCYIALFQFETVAQISSYWKFEPFHVYCVETDDFVSADKSVADRRRTDEKWLLAPHEFHHVVRIPTIKSDYWWCPGSSIHRKRRALIEVVSEMYSDRRDRYASKRVLQMLGFGECCHG